METKLPAVEPLLMTATINVGNTPYVKINNSEERLLEYLCALISWIKLTPVNQIIFCENSQTDYDFHKIQQFAKDEGKNLEVLVFDGNREAQRYGKGYGEGKIIKYALQGSSHLNDNINFYKITGRLFIPEFCQIQQQYAQFSNVFKIHQSAAKKKVFESSISLYKETFKSYLFSLKTRGFKAPHNPNVYVNAAFFKSNVAFFKKNLLDSYKRVNDKVGYYLEHAYYDDLIGKNFTSMDTKYDIIGRSGSRGHVFAGDYSDEIKKIAKTFIKGR